MKFYLIGIKGSGMSSLFNLLTDDGYEVVGSDIEKYIYTEDNLKKRKAKIYSLNDKSYLNNYFVIIGHDFIEPYLLRELKRNKIPYLEYHKFLNFYLDKRKLVSISGSHGKTTLTSLLNHSTPSSCLIGNGNAKMDNNTPYFFLESCEYKNHFHIYNPSFIIITNIDYDHVDYFTTENEYILSFKKFANKAFKGLIEYEASKKINNPYYFTFGLTEKADFYLKDYEISNNGIKGTLYFQNDKITSFSFKNLYGYPLLMDVLICLSFHYLHHNDLEIIKKRLSTYMMTDKRFNILKFDDKIIIEDYAHHPTQIKENYNTLKALYPNKKLIAFFKPDRISRLIHFKKDFIKALSLFDKSYILPFDSNEYGQEIIEMENDKIEFLNKDLNIENNKNNVYILMSSKNMDKIKNILKNES